MTAETLTFDDNKILSDLCGPHDSHLALLEQRTGVKLLAKGNTVTVVGSDADRRGVIVALRNLYTRIASGVPASLADVDAALRLADTEPADQDTGAPENSGPSLDLPRRKILPRTKTQRDYLQKMDKNELVFGVGPAGTGKTYLAVAHGARALLRGDVDRLILSRPAVEAGERIGFLPGDMKEKVDPYLRPLYDALYDVLHADYVDRKIAAQEIEIAPLAFMRGRTLSRAVVILDEAQNATIAQMKMFLTRLGEGSRMVVTGDPSQTDLPDARQSGLADALGLLNNVDSVGAVRFSGDDVVRHRLVRDIVRAYDHRARIKSPPSKDEGTE